MNFGNAVNNDTYILRGIQVSYGSGDDAASGGLHGYIGDFKTSFTADFVKEHGGPEPPRSRVIDRR